MPGWHFTPIVICTFVVSIICPSASTAELIIRPALPDDGWILVEKHLTEGYPISIGISETPLILLSEKRTNSSKAGSIQPSTFTRFRFRLQGLCLPSSSSLLEENHLFMSHIASAAET